MSGIKHPLDEISKEGAKTTAIAPDQTKPSKIINTKLRKKMREKEKEDTKGNTATQDQVNADTTVAAEPSEKPWPDGHDNKLFFMHNLPLFFPNATPSSSCPSRMVAPSRKASTGCTTA